MITNNLGIELIKKFEGFKSNPYLCPAKVPTIGYGATYYPNGTKVKLTDKEITEEYATEMLKLHLKHYEEIVNRYVTSELTPNRFSALVSFTYNLGARSLKISGLLKRVNANPNDTYINNEFNKWVYAGGKKLKGLVTRRRKEAELYFKK